MAGYSIVLNLKGNAVERTEKLSLTLAQAAKNATLLASKLSEVNVAARTIPSRSIRVGNVSQVAGASQANFAKSLAVASTAANVNAKAQTAAATAATANATAQRASARATNYTRHRSTRIASYGTGFNIGGFSGRLSTILQPDANGQLFGLNAAKLAKSLNIAGIVSEVFKQVSKAIIKTVAYSTAAPFALGGGILLTSLRALRSESFAEGVRLISRRHQANLALGEAYAQADINTDFLASTYGLDRSTALSSINVLTGLGVGGTDRKLTLNEATGLTKVSGLISQHHGVPFERVATNIQQLLVQDKPHIRDIRELLNQAPILGKYALREMESKGIVGMDVRTYLKDQKNILSALKSYELDIGTNQGMQARGRINLAQQDAWAKIASNDPFWQLIGNEGSNIITSIANTFNNILTSLAGNKEFSVMLRNIEVTFNKLAENSDKIVSTIVSIADRLSSFFGIDNKTEARYLTDREDAVKYALNSPKVLAEQRRLWETSSLPVSTTQEGRDKEFKEYFSNLVAAAQKDENILRSIMSEGRLRNVDEFGLLDIAGRGGVRIDNQRAIAQQGRAIAAPGYERYLPSVNSLWSPANAFAAYTVPLNALEKFSSSYISDLTKIGTLDPSQFKSNGEAQGDDLTGANRDRRSLIINFNDKLIEWNNTVITSEPEQTVDRIAEELELMLSAGIQRALLGATGSMSTRF